MPDLKSLKLSPLDVKLVTLAPQRVQALIEPARLARTGVQVVPYLLPEQLTVCAGPRLRLQLQRPTILTLIDDQPEANWAHPCRYVLHDPNELGAPYQVVHAEFPPSLLVSDLPTVSALRPELRVRPEVFRPKLTVQKIPRFPLKRAAERHALLYSGQSNNRHLNDLEYLYRVLVDLYDYDPANILVLNYDGTINHADAATVSLARWPGDDTPYRIRVTGSGSEADLNAAFDTLKSRLRTGDSLLFHTNNHGGTDANGAFLCTREPDGAWGGYSTADLAAKLAALPKISELVVMMEQCFSGGFRQTVLDNTTATRTSFASAAPADKVSMGGQHFDPFAEDWISALTGYDAALAPLVFNADNNGSGELTTNEAFAYASDTRTKHASDFPIYGDKPDGCGAQLTVGKRVAPTAIDVAAWDRGRLDIFVRGSNAALHHMAWDGRWHPWENRGGALHSPPRVVSWAPGRLDVFALGTDNALHHQAFDGQWRPWESLGGKFPEVPQVVSWAPGRLDILGRGLDGALWHQWFDGRWHAWESLGGVLSSPPSVVSWSSGRLDIFARGSDGALWHQWFDQGWGAWESLGGTLSSAPCAVSWAPGRLDIFARGAGRKLMHHWYDQRWVAWESLCGVLRSAPAVVSWAPGRLDIFAVGDQRDLVHHWYEQQWGSWESLGGEIVSTPAVSTWAPGRLDIFAVGNDQALWHHWYEGNWGQWESLGGVIA